MKTRLRNLLVRLCGALKGGLPDRSGPVYRLLAWHRIKPRQTVAFRQQLDRLQAQYNVVTPGEFERGEGRTGELNLVLSFDDGYLEWESVVLPELDRRNLEGLFFVCPDLPGLTGEDARRYVRENLWIQPTHPVTPEGVTRLREAGHTLGNHLLGHEDLRDVSDPDHLRETFAASQRTFEERFGVRPRWVGYPYADAFRDPAALVRAAGRHFEFGATLIPGWNHRDTPPLFLRRDSISPDLPAPVEAAWLRGGYDPLFRFTHLTGGQTALD